MFVRRFRYVPLFSESQRSRIQKPPTSKRSGHGKFVHPLFNCFQQFADFYGHAYKRVTITFGNVLSQRLPVDGISPVGF